MTEQRDGHRYETDWVARYRFSRRKGWQDCQILDVSRNGAALELRGVEPARVAGEARIHLQIQSVLGVGRGAPLLADVRHCRQTAPGRVRIGVEFHDLPAEQFRLLGLMVGLRSTA